MSRRVDIDGISYLCNQGQHLVCEGCKDPCHPRSGRRVEIPTLTIRGAHHPAPPEAA